MTAVRIDGAAIAQEIRSEVAEGVAEMKAKHDVVPGLAVVLVGDDPASAVYVRNKERAASEIDMRAEVIRLPAETSQAELLQTLDRVNADGTAIVVVTHNSQLASRASREIALSSGRAGIATLRENGGRS